jgi:hypothetical protein
MSGGKLTEADVDRAIDAQRERWHDEMDAIDTRRTGACSRANRHLALALGITLLATLAVAAWL